MPVRIGATFAALALLSCSPALAADNAEPVEYGKVTIAQAAPPARFAAGWPSSAAALKTWYEDTDALPVNHAVDGLLAGDVSLLERLQAASLAVEDRDRAGWVRQIHELLEFGTVSPGFCANARPAIEGEPSALREALAPSFVEDCLMPGDRPLVLRVDTPASAVIAYFVPEYRFHDAQPAPWDDRFAMAVREEFAAGDNAWARSRAATMLLRHPDPRAEAALLALYRELPEGDDKTELAMLLRRARSAEARAIGNSVCKKHPDSRPCASERARSALTIALPVGLEVIDVDEVASLPVDIPEPEAPPEELRLVTEQLIAAGFDGLRGFDPAGIDTTEPVLAILGEAGYLHGFDVETGVFPNAHDSLMRKLAALTGDAFAGALFDEIPPVYDEDADEETGPYRLSVYLGGKRYRIDAENHGDWYDLPAVMALMNAVLADRGSGTRLFTLDTGSQTAIVVAATPEAFASAVAAGLLEPGDPGASEEGGKAYEAEVLRQLL